MPRSESAGSFNARQSTGTAFTDAVGRLHTAYDNIGHSSGRPYLYFVYPPEHELYLRRLADEQLRNDGDLRYVHIDLLDLTLASLAGQETQREQLLADAQRGTSAGVSIVLRWARELSRQVQEQLAQATDTGRPVVVLRGLAALHPLGNPTALMEAVAENEPCDPQTGRMAPFFCWFPVFAHRRPAGNTSF